MNTFEEIGRQKRFNFMGTDLGYVFFFCCNDPDVFALAFDKETLVFSSSRKRNEYNCLRAWRIHF